MQDGPRTGLKSRVAFGTANTDGVGLPKEIPTAMLITSTKVR